MGLNTSTLYEEREFLNEWTLSDQLHENHQIWVNNLNPNF